MASISPNRYSLQSCGDQYIRFQLPKFRGPRYFFGDDEDESDQISKSTHEVQSVVENVQMLEKALQEHAIGQDPFGEAWQNAIVAYTNDLERRIYPLIFKDSVIGVYRESVLVMAKCAAESELRDLVTNGPKGPPALGHGWVFFLLETYLGGTLSRYHKSLPEDGGDHDEEVTPQLLEEAHFSFDVDKPVAISAIKRIHSSRQLGQAVQFFDMAGGELEVTEQGLLPKEPEIPRTAPIVPGDRRSYLDLYCSMPEATHDNSSHNVVIVLSQEIWEKASAGLGAGYVSWNIKDSVSGYYLLGFSSLLKAQKVDD